MNDFYSWRYLGNGQFGVYHVFPPTDGERAKVARMKRSKSFLTQIEASNTAKMLNAVKDFWDNLPD
jgi:hypothetical protein